MTKIVFPVIVCIVFMSPWTSSAQKPPGTSDKDRALLEAVSAGDVGKVVRLLTQGANPNAKDKMGDTPLMLACSAVTKSTGRAIKTTPAAKMPSFVFARETESTSGTAKAKLTSIQNRVKLIEALLGKGADINAANPKGKTALMFASTEGYASTIYNLDGTLSKGTPSSTIYGSPTLVKLLLARGADCKAKDRDGKTALDLCNECASKEVGLASFTKDPQEGVVPNSFTLFKNPLSNSGYGFGY